MPNHVRNLYAAVHGLAILSLQFVCCVLCRHEVLIILLKIAEYTESPRIFMVVGLIDEYIDWLDSFFEKVLVHFITARSYGLQFMCMVYDQSLKLLMSAEVCFVDQSSCQ